MKKISVFLSILFLTLPVSNSCGPYTPRNADLTVEYEGKIVHSAEKETRQWASPKFLESFLEIPGGKFIIFGAEWCQQCKILRKAIKQAEVSQNFVFLNVDEEWVVKLLAFYRIKTVPTMLEINEETKIIAIKAGAGPIVLHMLLK